MVDQAAAREIFEHELAALTDAEEKTAEVLGKIVPQIHSLKLQQLIANYQQVKTGQVKRLADIFKLRNVSPRTAPTEGVGALIAEFPDFVEAETPSDIGYDVCAAGFAAKTAADPSDCSKYLNGRAHRPNNNNR